MNKVAILMGSKSDMPVVQHCIDMLNDFGVKYEVRVSSAHRTPKQTAAFATSAHKKGSKVIIAFAGMAAHLAGVIASHTTLPVIGVPVESKYLAGIDSLFSTVQMPSGVPVGCMAIGNAGAKNAAIFAVEILALSDAKLNKKLQTYKKKLGDKILKG